VPLIDRINLRHCTVHDKLRVQYRERQSECPSQGLSLCRLTVLLRQPLY